MKTLGTHAAQLRHYGYNKNDNNRGWELGALVGRWDTVCEKEGQNTLWGVSAKDRSTYVHEKKVREYRKMLEKYYSQQPQMLLLSATLLTPQTFKDLINLWSKSNRCVLFFFFFCCPSSAIFIVAFI